MRKRGAHHSRIAVIPLGVKVATKYELGARAALLALGVGAGNDQHLADLVVLASLCRRLPHPRHIGVHSEAVFNLIGGISDMGSGAMDYGSYAANPLQMSSLSSSVDVLLEWMLSQRNSDIARICVGEVRRLAA